MPTTKSPFTLPTGSGIANDASVPEAALTFPVGAGSGGAAGGGLAAHLADPVGAHNASAIALQPDSGVYDEAHVQQALDELGYIAPAVNELGEAVTGVPNSGVPTWDVDVTRETGGFRNGSGGDHGGLGLGATVETLNILPDGTNITVTALVYPADRGTIGILRIDPDGTEVDIGVKIDLAAAFTEATRETGQADFSSINAGMYDLVLDKRVPVKTDYTDDPSTPYTPYATEWAQYQLARLTITLYEVWASIPLTGETYRLIHVIDGAAFVTASTQFGIAVPTPGSVPLEPDNVLMRERVFESSLTAPVFVGVEPTITPDVPGAPPGAVQASGVFAFGPTDTFDVTVDSEAADDCFDTGADVAGDVTLGGGRDPVEYDLSDFGISSSGLAFDETIEAWSAASAPDVTDNFSSGPTNVSVGSGGLNVEASRNGLFRVTLNRPGVPSVPAPHASVTDTILVTAFDALNDPTKRTSELFGRDDPHRIEQDRSMMAPGALGLPLSTYDSTAAIDSGPASVADALQVAFGELIWPQDDYTSGHLPTTGQPSYLGFASDPTGTTRYYQRFIEMPSYARRGIIEIEGIDFTDFGKEDGEVFDTTFWDTLLTGGVLSASHMASRKGQVLVLIAIPGLSGWMDLGTFRGDGAADINTQGHGCLTRDLGSNQFEFDLGWSPAASTDPTPVPHVAVRVYYFMDAGTVVLTKGISRIAFV